MPFAEFAHRCAGGNENGGPNNRTAGASFRHDASNTKVLSQSPTPVPSKEHCCVAAGKAIIGPHL